MIPWKQLIANTAIRLSWLLLHAGCAVVLRLCPYSHINSLLSIQVTFWAIIGLVVCLYLIVSLSDPGYVKTDAKIIADNDAVVFNQGLCKYCHRKQLMRTRHCRSCNMCISRMDHHCVWAANCVGAGNHRSFIVYILMQHLLTVSVAVESIWTCIVGFMVDPWNPLVWLCAVVALFCLIFGLFTFVLLRLQMKLITHGYTTAEYLSGLRLPWVKGKLWGEYSPYHTGFWSDLRHFWLDMKGFNYSLPIGWQDTTTIPKEYNYIPEGRKMSRITDMSPFNPVDIWRSAPDSPDVEMQPVSVGSRLPDMHGIDSKDEKPSF